MAPMIPTDPPPARQAGCTAGLSLLSLMIPAVRSHPPYDQDYPVTGT